MRNILFAVGGNSLIKDNRHMTVEDQYEAICETTKQIADIIEAGNNAIITHGNGPQVGFILQRSEIAHEIAHMHTVPLVSCDADTQGAIGYQIQQALDNEFRSRNLTSRAVTIITQVLVDPDDPAFKKPAKPIGKFYTENEYRLISKVHKEWTMTEDAGRGYRRVVASPAPVDIVELDAIHALYRGKFTVIAAGGGGIPVIMQDGKLQGIDAVIDKDQASALLASRLKLDVFMISTSVRNVSVDFNTPRERPLAGVAADEIRRYLQENQFAEGSMKPKIEAALYFLENGGKEVIITDPQNLADAYFGGSGTHISLKGNTCVENRRRNG